MKKFEVKPLLFLYLLHLFNVAILQSYACPETGTNSIKNCRQFEEEEGLKYSNLIANKPPRRRLKILINSPTIGWSHCQFQGSLADALIDAGHEVHIFTFALNAFVGNYTGTEKAHKTIRHLRPAHIFHAMQNLKFTTDQYSGPINLILAGAMQDLTRLLADGCQEILADSALLQQLTAEKYDFGISESYDVCMFGIFHKIGIRAMAASQAVSMTSLLNSFFGIPTFASFVYGFWTFPSNPLKMTFQDRARNLFNEIYEYSTVRNLPYEIEPMFTAAFGKDFPSLREITRNISLAFVNNNEFFAISRPISHKVKFVGGIVGEKSSLNLSPQFASIIKHARKGVILFTLGTYADTRNMNIELRTAFVDAFAKFPEFEFIWKFTVAENDTFGMPPNVHIFDWVEQLPILANSKTKLFITHCGLNSANEAAKYGVPVLGIPLFGDQFYNAAIIANKQTGIILDIREIQKQKSQLIESALHELLSSRTFAKQASMVRQKLALNPFRPSDRLVKWVEFASEFPDLNELNMPDEEDLSLFTYYSLDVISAFCFVFVSFIAFCAIIAIKLLYIARELSNCIIMGKFVKTKSH